MIKQRILICILLAMVASIPRTASGQTVKATEEALVDFFERKVRPVLANNCNNCHSANNKAIANLRVDDRNGLVKGGNRGPAVIPGNPEKSLLIQAVRKTHPKVKMPPDHDLTEQEIADLTTWIKDGAAWPAVRVPASIGRPNAKYELLRKEHWAWQPLRALKTPPVENAAWARDEIDRFVLATLENKKLTPVGDADRLTLIRRVTFDLTGLPPTLAEIDGFLGDKSANAFEKVVDRLLASPAYGERWGRHWLDVARYAESTGSARNLPYPHAWRYRDYVIDAFNSDKPYDQFIREQIAGDLLPARNQQERDTQLIATGFLALGVKDVNQRFKVRFVMDNIDEQIDTVTRSVLALTASCARCHDHKFDPVPVTDYYALAGIFHSSDHCSGLRNQMGGAGLAYYEPTLLLKIGSGAKTEPDAKTKERIAQLTKEVAVAKAEFDSIKGTAQAKEPAGDGRNNQMVARQKWIKLQAELLALNDPAKDGAALGIRDSKTVGDTEIRIRGEAKKLGPVVPRGFLSVLNVPDAPKVNPNQSGRLELAQWLTSKNNPLAQRVIVNRVWQHLFGKGIVSSVDNFGTTGDTPTHPELLDHLAARFVKDGWSIKKLVRTVVLTRSYQLGYDAPKENVAADPANRLVWRHSPRRLDAEEIRDAMLLASGKLDLTRPKASPASELQVIELNSSGPRPKAILDAADKSIHRSVYLPLLRGLTPRPLEVFDFAEQGMVTGSRDTTTVAPQALYLLNDPFVLQQSETLAKKLRDHAGLDDTGRISLAFRWTLNRPATQKEVAGATFYLGDYEARLHEEAAESKIDARAAAWASFSQALLASAEFRYVR